MRVLVASEAHFTRRPDGSVYAQGAEDYDFWSRYLATFSEVGVLARLREPADPSCETGRAAMQARADGPGVRFHPLTDYRGPWQYLCRLGALRFQVRAAIAESIAGRNNAAGDYAARYDALILRAPGAVAYLAWRAIPQFHIPWAVEVLGDPWEALAPGCVAGLWRPIARRWSRRSLERLCAEAPLACYVTRNRLQQRYPALNGQSFACSDVRLSSLASEPEMEARISRIAEARSGLRPWELGFVGSLEQLYKAPEVHLRAVRLCLDRGFAIRFSLLGEGRYRPTLEHLAAQMGLTRAVRFLGAMPPGTAVEQFLDGLDLFVLASRTEGLPRALVEAMARGCPAIGSNAGGIPELLDAEDLVAAGSAPLLAKKISEVLTAPGRVEAMARRNRTVAAGYAHEKLETVRARFLAELAGLVRRGRGRRAPDRAALRPASLETELPN